MDPPLFGAFSTPLWCRCSFVPCKKQKTDQTRRSFQGVQNVFLPHAFCTPACHDPNLIGDTESALMIGERNTQTYWFKNGNEFSCTCSRSRRYAHFSVFSSYAVFVNRL